MESPRPLEDAKQVRWIARPSEEQLLGPPARPPREVRISFEPPPPPDWDLGETAAAAEDGVAARGWRLGPRDLVALAAVSAVVWLAAYGSEGLPFHSSEAAAPAAAGEIVRTTLAPDRLEVKRTPNAPAANAPDATKDGGGKKDQSGSSGSGGRDDDHSGGGGGGSETTKPLLEATIPGVGTVTVDQPELPQLAGVEAPPLPRLLETDDVLPAALTVSLP
jgi:hypothetical protein